MYKIISMSDIITNSSSEVFCRIKHPDPDILSHIYDLIYELFGYNQEYEITPVVDKDGDTVTIDLPYCLNDFTDFFRGGLEALLKDYKNCTIIYE